MGATLIPWWDDPATVKPNEFERGVLTGMLLKCGKSEEPEPTKPEGAVGEWSVEYLFKGGAKLETWVTDDGVKEYSGTLYEQVYLHQRKTYTDGTVDEWKQQLVSHSGKGIHQNYGWEFVFNDPTNNSTYNGVIRNGTLWHWTKTNPANKWGANYDLNWYIPTTEPTVIL